jgi:hypothetical protein
MNEKNVREYVKLLIDEALIAEAKKIREVDVSDGSKAKHGSTKHIKDLETRIVDLKVWQGRQKKGSEARANYSRLIQRLNAELASAKRASKPKEKRVDEINDIPEVPSNPEERWEALAKSRDIAISSIVSAISAVGSPRELGKIKKNIEQSMDAGEEPAEVTDGFVDWLINRKKAALRDANTHIPNDAGLARVDRMARTMDSDGRARARKMK